jgi:hypothetical protein
MDFFRARRSFGRMKLPTILRWAAALMVTPAVAFGVSVVGCSSSAAPALVGSDAGDAASGDGLASDVATFDPCGGFHRTTAACATDCMASRGARVVEDAGCLAPDEQIGCLPSMATCSGAITCVRDLEAGVDYWVPGDCAQPGFGKCAFGGDVATLTACMLDGGADAGSAPAADGG